jgi:alkylation response protein AidB-like acyl-CoA dehydrogenase
MYFAVSPEQEMLRDSVRSYLEAKAPLTRVREIMEMPEGFDQDMWEDMAEMGWQSMAIPEDYGGAGYTVMELGVVLEELGRMLTPVPFLSSVVLGANAVLLAGSAEQQARYLPAVASGQTRLAFAAAETSGAWSDDSIALTAEDAGSGVTLTGEKSFVVDGHTADLLVVAAREADASVGFYIVEAGSEGLSAEPLETMDMTRKQASVGFSGVTPVDRLEGDTVGVVDRLYDIAAVMLAFEQVGGAQRCLEMSVDYAKERVQFGRAIGSFQAVKHQCADMLVGVEAARSAALYAGWALATGDSDLPVAAALAKARCSAAFYEAASESIQIHGGIGFTWEHDAHLYFKRAKTDQLLFGGPEEWRAKLADRLGL